jgi:hypothetical protein
MTQISKVSVISFVLPCDGLLRTTKPHWRWNTLKLSGQGQSHVRAANMGYLLGSMENGW